MAGTPGQPSTKPTQLPGKVPGEDLSEAAQAYLNDIPEMSDAAQSYLAESPDYQGPAPEAPAASYESPLWAKAIPPVMGIVGGIAGAVVGGPPGAVAGAAAGGAAGQGYREALEQYLNDKPYTDPNDQLKDVALAGAEEGAGQLIGMGLAKGAGLAAKGASKFIPESIKAPMSSTFKTVRSKIEDPIMKVITEKFTPMTKEASGDSVKQMLKQSIQTKYGPFTQAYAALDDVAKAVPVKDEARRKFTMGLKEWGVENHGGDNWRVIKKFADDIDAANTGKQLDDVLGQIRDARSVAYKSGATGQAKMLEEMHERAANFAEGELTKLASRVQAGGALPEEAIALQRLAQQRGLPPEEASKYARSLAKDYLAAKDKIRTDYSGFRQFLTDVGEQTKVRANGKGPMVFLDQVDNVPSEKLIERMFDPKNAAALRRMEQETPEVFDLVSKARMRSIVEKASPDGKINLELFRKELYRIPEDSRKMLMSREQLELLNKTIADPSLRRLDRINRMGENAVSKWAQGMMDIGAVVGQGVANSPGASAGVRQAVGDSVREAGRVGISLMRPPEE